MQALEKDFLSHLNEHQKLAVTQAEGPMLVLAGAGSGKTRTITYKIAYLIDQGICRPEQILAVTFTNKAAEEMRNRVEKLLTHLDASPLVSTFHSFGVRVLRRHADLIDYGKDFTICDRDDQKRVLKAVYEELHFTDSQLPMRKTLAAISRSKSNNWDPEEYAKKSRDLASQEISLIYSAYERFLKGSNAMDFDDLLLLTVRLLTSNPEVRQSYGEWYRHILIDEYQDTNRPQYDLIRNLTEVHQNITAVGDEDQSIYGFRGSDIKNILRFEKDFPGAKIIKLEQNYRSTQNILDAASSLVSNNINRKGKVLWTDQRAGPLIDLLAASNAKTEAAYVSHRISDYLRQGEEGIAVLYRTNFQSRQFEEALRRLKIPYKLIGGVSFYRRKEIKDALAYLRVVVNPDDNVSFLRIINQPPRGIGQVTLDHLHQRAREEKISLWRALQEGLEGNAFPGQAHRVLQPFLSLIDHCQNFLELPLHLLLEKTIEAAGLITAFKNEDSEDAHNRILNLEELIMLARENVERGYTLQEFLDHAALRSEADDYDESASVSLMTLHNAKGLEFPIVFMVGCEEGLFPHSRSVAEDDLEEERRICYVGLTRAQKKIHLTYSRRRRFFGREGEEMNDPSRFLQEIPEHLISISSDPFSVHESAQPTSGSRVYRQRKRAGNIGMKTYNSTESVRGFLSKLSQQGKSSNSKFVSGARIVHEQFGYGKILGVQETDDDLKITVQFPGLGIKRLLQSYAKLKLV